MEHPETIKALVKEKYGIIAESASSCCGPVCGCGNGTAEAGTDTVYAIMNDAYQDIEGYNPDADLKLGCGLPVEYAGLKPGQTVVDLGSGAGNDLFVARSIVGETGYLIGVDFTPQMVEKAKQNRDKLGYGNMEFLLGDIESLPLADQSVDVVISNCVLNLVPDKARAFGEIYRVLKTGGHFSVSDIVLHGSLPPQVQKAAEFYAGCVSGALQRDDYLEIARSAGFGDTIEVAKTKPITIPKEVMDQVLYDLPESERTMGSAEISSITVTGRKL